MLTTTRNAPILEAVASPVTFATVLLAIMIDRYGVEPDDDSGNQTPVIFKWAPETLRMQIADDFAPAEMPAANFDRLMAAIAIMTTDRFFTDAAAFGHLCAVFSGDSFQPDTYAPPPIVDCAWGITEALLLDPPTPENPDTFSDDVRHYLSALLDSEGMIKPPDILRLALGGDRSGQVQQTWGDDAEMTAAIWETQNQKSAEITEVIHDNLRQLLAQLEALPLHNAETQGLAKRIGLAAV